jgi:hypothetical protein
VWTVKSLKRNWTRVEVVEKRKVGAVMRPFLDFECFGVWRISRALWVWTLVYSDWVIFAFHIHFSLF